LSPKSISEEVEKNERKTAAGTAPTN